MDILEILGKIGFDWQVALANLVNFLIIYWIISRFAFKPIQEIITKRQAKISEGLDSAKEAETALKLAQIKSKEIATEARAEANIIITKAKEAGDLMILKAEDDAKKKAMEVAKKAEASIKQDQVAAEKYIKTKAADLIASGVQKILQEDMTSERSQDISKRAASQLS